MNESKVDIESYLWGLMHMLITASFGLAILFLVSISGLFFLLLIMGFSYNILIALVLILSVYISLFILKPKIATVSSVGRFIFASAILPIFLSISLMMSEYYGFGITQAAMTQIPVFGYILYTYIIVSRVKKSNL